MTRRGVGQPPVMDNDSFIEEEESYGVQGWRHRLFVSLEIFDDGLCPIRSKGKDNPLSLFVEPSDRLDILDRKFEVFLVQAGLDLDGKLGRYRPNNLDGTIGIDCWVVVIMDEDVALPTNRPLGGTVRGRLGVRSRSGRGA